MLPPAERINFILRTVTDEAIPHETTIARASVIAVRIDARGLVTAIVCVLFALIDVHTSCKVQEPVSEVTTAAVASNDIVAHLIAFSIVYSTFVSI